MSTPNPLVPQGTFPDKGKSHIRIAVFAILAVHVVLLGALLIAGCKRTSDQQPLEPTNAVVPPPTIEPPPLPPPPLPVDTNVPTPPPVTPPPDTSMVQPPPVLPPVVAPSMTEHTLVKGETFAALAKKYGVSVRSIIEANPELNPSRLKIGDKVKIPAATPKATSNGGLGTGAATTGGGEKLYTVKSGDTLMKIGKSHGVTVKALRAANNLKTDQIKVGQKLKIPAKGGATPPPAEPTPAPAPPPTPMTAPPGSPAGNT